MYHHALLLSHILLLCSLTPSHASAPDRFFKSASAPYSPNASTKYFEVTQPLPTDFQTPSYSLTLLQHDFNNTIGSPPVSANYSTPCNCSANYSLSCNCSFPWTDIVVEFSATCRGEQYDRIAAVWIDGVEILRTSTAEPTEQGIFWKVRKDVTRYASVFMRSNATVSVMLENLVNDVFTGIYHVNVSLHFYGGQDSSLGAVENGEEGNQFKLSGKLGFWGEDNSEEERKIGSLGEESRELGFWVEERAEREGKLAFPSKESDQSKSLGKDCVDSEDVYDADDWGRKLGFSSEESEDRKRKSGLLGKEMPSKKGKEKKEKKERKEKEGEKGGFLSKESASLINREEKLKSGFSHEEHPLPKTLRLQSNDHRMMGKRVKSNRLYRKPADLVVPISDKGDSGFWFRIENESDIHSKEIKIPVNTYRAVLEIYVSFHSNDEFWYSNPPNSYIQQNNLTTGRGNGAFRQVFVTVDGLYVGSVVPFPVVFTGGINPLFWEPVVGIGAFDLPSYDLDLTPFLGLLLDGNLHSFSLGVTDGISFWLVDANLHLWLDHSSPQVIAKLVKYKAPDLSISRKSKFGKSGEKFKIKAERETHFAGWVNSSFGNRTTHVEYELEFKNSIKFKNNGNFKEVEQKIEAETEIRVEAYSVLLLAKAVYENEYPLHIETKTEPKGNNTYLSTTEFSHGMKEDSKVVLPNGIFISFLDNSQDSEGWMLVQDHSVLSGVASTKQEYKHRDEEGCYSRTVVTNGGQLMEDNSINVCLEPL